MRMDKLIFWEMNEINFNYVNYYINQGKLPNWKKFIKSHGLFKTISENKYEDLEPWIQWPSVRTGLTNQDHGLFRLGDIEGSGLKQHWEIIEENGYTVAAISPINGANNTQNSPFWIPDPWVETKVSGKGFISRIAKAIKQAVNDNSSEKLETKTILAIFEGLLTKSQLSSWPQYISGLFGVIKRQHWSKAIILDRLLSDIFVCLWSKYQPDFSVLFLNSGAHIQHHYMCNSSAYNGQVKNPSWYINEQKDPLLEILELYDSVLYELQKIKNTRLMIAVGIQQIPYEKPTFYWRLKDHGAFVTKLGIKYKKIQPRMTRDFLIEFHNHGDLIKAESILTNIKSDSGEKIFREVDNRGKDLFVSLTHSDDISDQFSFFLDTKEFTNFRDDVVFVAIKNGHHDKVGYYLDSNRKPNDLKNYLPVHKIFDLIMNHFKL